MKTLTRRRLSRELKATSVSLAVQLWTAAQVHWRVLDLEGTTGMLAFYKEMDAQGGKSFIQSHTVNHDQGSWHYKSHVGIPMFSLHTYWAPLCAGHPASCVTHQILWFAESESIAGSWIFVVTEALAPSECGSSCVMCLDALEEKWSGGNCVWQNATYQLHSPPSSND